MAKPVKRWTAATLGFTEALLTGVPGTVKRLCMATGASTSTAGLALRFLTDRGLLTPQAARGRNSGRSVCDASQLLESYADAISKVGGAPGVQVGVLWRDPVEGLSQIGRRWDEAHLDWAATGALGAAELAPLQTQVAGQPCRCKGRVV